MKSFKDLIKVNTATDKMNTFDLSCDSITTSNFFETKVIYSKEIVPKETTEINLESYIRLSPLNYPTFMRCTNQVRAFYVPFRTVWMGWNNFITQSETPAASLIPEVPLINNEELIKFFVGSNFAGTAYAHLQSATADNYDYVLNADGDLHKYKLTDKGRRLMDVLTGLGYRLCWSVENQSYFIAYSILPILCYYKVIYDWYMVNQYFPVNKADQVRLNIGYGHSVSDADKNLILSGIASFTANYDKDYFTSAFANPTGPSGNSVGTISINDNTFDYNNLRDSISVDGSYPAKGTPVVSMPPVEGYGRLTQFAVDALKSLTDYMKRHQLVGSQAAERFLARFGVKLDSAKINKSLYLGSDSINIQIGDIQSTNYDFNGDYPLGVLAGKGVGYGNNGHFKVSSDEFGMLILVSDIVPHVGYSQGVKRQVMHTSALDYYTPEFDGLGTQAIAMKEICLPKNGTYSSDLWCGVNSGEGVFGYTPRYAEYKVGNDFMSGNFIYDSTNYGESAWYGTRMFNDNFNGAQEGRMQGDITAGYGFLNSYYDGDQFSRIFATEDNALSGNDHFRTIYHLDVKSQLPMSQLFDNYEFENKGKEITLPIGGETLSN